MSLASREQTTPWIDPALCGDAALRPQALAALRSLLAKAGPEQDIYLTLPVPTPGSAEALFELEDQAVYWLGRDGDLVVCLGAGCTFAFDANGDGQAQQAARLARQAGDRLSRCVTGAAAGAPNERVRCFGGVAFQPGQAHLAPWQPFGDGSFQVPRLTFRRQGRQWLLSVFIPHDESASAEQQLHDALLLASKLPSLRPAMGSPAKGALAGGADEQSFAELVRDILGRIEEGSCTKIVAALRSELTFTRPLNIPATLAELKRYDLATVFAFKRGAFTFCGATPERLVKKEQLQISTEALAGTFRRTGSDYGRELLRSPKEHEEHQPVLDAITSALRPLCARLDFPAQPEICELAHLLHLRTPITGQLKAPTHVLSLVAELHPTPAVGGVPKETATAFIAEHESFERGWYAGPIGWFNSQGDGDFSVALRSGVLNGARAFLFAGAGIVAGSEPQTEFAETQLKLRSLRTSLRY